MDPNNGEYAVHLRSEREVVGAVFKMALINLLMAEFCLLTANALGYANWTNFLSALTFDWRYILLGLAATPVFIAFTHVVKIVQLKYVALDRGSNESPEVTVKGSASIAVYSGSSEEVLFRGVIQPVIGVALTSLLFGLFHVQQREDWPYAMYTFVCGVAFGLLFHLTGNLWVSIIVHVLHNFIAGYKPEWYVRLLTRIYAKALGG